MSNALNSFLASKNAPVATPQSLKAAKGQKKNNAGGFSFVVSDATRLIRFLVLGTEENTYYVSSEDLTAKAVKFLQKYAASNAAEYFDTLMSVVRENRAPKNDYALFAFAVLYQTGNDKQAYRKALPEVARTSTHLFTFVEYMKGLGAFSSSAQKAVAEWYTSKEPGALAYQVVKYRQRNGYTHRDILRLSHPKGLDKSVGDFILNKTVTEESPALIAAFAQAQSVSKVSEAVSLIKANKALPWEAFPTAMHSEPAFWSALFYAGMGQTALLRNLKRFSKLGMFKDLKFAGDVAKALKDPEAISKGRMHPVQYLNAYFAFTQGSYGSNNLYRGSREVVSWDTPSKVVAALEAGYYLSFGNVESSGKRIMLSLDVSGSMQSPVGGLSGLDCREASAAMAQVTLRTEDYVLVTAFSTSEKANRGGFYYGHRSSDISDVSGLRTLNLSETDSLKQTISKVSGLPFSGTDCSLPMRYALQNKLEIDTFVVYTDNETWAGPQHPHEALEAYRKAMGIDARLVVVGMTGTKFTIASPSDPLMLDVVGFDSAAPRIMSDFSKGLL